MIFAEKYAYLFGLKKGEEEKTTTYIYFAQYKIKQLIHSKTNLMIFSKIKM